MSLKLVWMTILSFGLILSGCSNSLWRSAEAVSSQPSSKQSSSPSPQSKLTSSPLASPSLTQAQLSPTHSTPASPSPSAGRSPSPTAPAATQAKPATALSYEIATYRSTVMAGERSYGVSLPPGYAQNPQQRYPVIFLLHGGHGDPTDWWLPGKGNALPVLQALYQEGKLPPSIVITPDGNDKRGSSPYWDPQYIDGPNGKVATAIGDELVKLVQSRYRTLPVPEYWAIGGLSSGGWGAVNIGLHYANHFSVLFSHSGYFIDKSGANNSPLLFAKTLPASTRQRLRIYIDTGDEDMKYLSQAREFHQVLKQLQVSSTLREFSGSHQWRYWHQHLADSLSDVGQQFKASGLPARAVQN